MDEKVSIIIPVYNVEEYIDRCLQSVVNQTYTNIEILIMEAKSEDNSLSKVKKWENQDDRIIVVSRKDKGLADARNYAMNMSVGKYIIFLDSDDWIDINFVEKTMEIAMSDSQIDIVMADAKKYIYDTVVDNIGPEWTKIIYQNEKDKKQLLCFGSNFIWGKLFRRNLFEKNNIIQPILPFEDLAVYPVLISAANKIAMCHTTYAHYQADRENSLSSHRNTYKDLPKVYEYAKKKLKEIGKYSTYKEAFKLSMYIHFRIICLHCIGVENYTQLEKSSPFIAKFMNDNFSDLQKSSYIIYGGFALKWMVNEVCNGIEAIEEHITFTTIIAQMSRPDCAIKMYHCNSFREECINKDINGFLLNYKLKKNLPILFVDFMHECTDILYDGNENYISCSEAFVECGCKEGYESSSYFDYRKITWQSDEYWDLWKTKCIKFINKIERLQIKTVFLVKNKYAQFFKKNENKYSYVYEIEKKNALLDKMYDFFEKNCSMSTVCSLDCNLQYTEMVGRPYSSKPEYMNISFYRKGAVEIQSQLYSDYLK